MLNSLRIQRDTVALEFNVGGQLSSFFTNVIPEMINTFKGFAPSVDSGQPPIALTNDQRSFLKEISKHTYLDLAPLTVYVPEGMCVTYAEYVERLDVSVDHAMHVIDTALAPFTTYLSQLISNSDQRFDSKAHDTIFSLMEQGRKQANVAIGECFKRGSTQTQVKYSDAIARNADWESVLHNCDHLSNEMNRIDRKMIQKKVKECAELLDIIMAKAKRGEFNDASEVVVKNIAEGTFQIASELEFFSVTYYRVAAQLSAVNSTMEKLREILSH